HSRRSRFLRPFFSSWLQWTALLPLGGIGQQAIMDQTPIVPCEGGISVLSGSAKRAVLGLALVLCSLWAVPRGHAAEAVSGRVTTLRFLSDHKLICKNTRDLLTGGERYPDVAWSNDSEVNAPITHTGGAEVRVQAEITLALTGVAEETPYRLLGQSEE